MSVLMTIRQAADATALSDKVIRQAVNEGALLAKNVGKKDATRPTIRIRPEDLDAWVESLANVVN